MNKKIFSIFLIISEFLLVTGIVILGLKIREITTGQVKGIQYVTEIDKNNLMFSSESGELKYFYEPKPNTIEKWNPSWLGNEIANNINSDSLNEEIDYPTYKRPDVYRIIVLGDSTTYGLYVKTSENYSKLVENKLNNLLNCPVIHKFEVINLGVYGYDIAYIKERFYKRGLKYNPDLVILSVNNADFDESNELILPIVKKIVKSEIAHNKNYNSKEQWPLIWTEAENILIHEIDKYKINKEQFRILDDIKLIYDGKILIISSSLSETNKINILKFVHMGEKYRYTDKIEFHSYNKNFIFPDGHPNREGHKKIAEDVFNYLRQNTLKNCNIN